jgi:hypothetical protein
MDSFDFDAWAALARTSPDKFEQQRRDVVENYISSCRDNLRMRGLQWSIDMERIRARTPMKSCLRLSTLMWDAFIDLNNALNAAIQENCRSTGATSPPAVNARIMHVLTECKQNL